MQARSPIILSTLIAALGIAAAGCRSDPVPGARLDPADARFLPAAPPKGYRLCARRAGTDETPEPDGTERWAIWGDAALERPWEGRLAWLEELPDAPDDGHPGARPARVNGLPATIAPRRLAAAVAVEEWGHVVTWRPAPGRLVSLSYRGGAEDARRLAEKVILTDERPELPIDALGSSTLPLHRSTQGSGLNTPWPLPSQGDWSATFGAPDAAGGRGSTLVITGSERRDNAIELARFFSLRSEEVAIDGWTGARYAAWDVRTGPFGVILERDGRLLAISSTGATETEVTQVFESLGRVDDAAWDALTPDAAACPRSGEPLDAAP